MVREFRMKIKKSNEIGKVKNNDKGILDENEKSNENREGGYNYEEIHE